MQKNNLSGQASIEEYQTQILKPSLFDMASRSPQYLLADLFLRRYLVQPHVQTVNCFDTINQHNGRIQAYRQRYTTEAGEHLWQVCAIDTSYGHVYLSLRLQDDGTIPLDTPGVFVTYDGAGMDAFIARTEFQQLQRFGHTVFHYQPTITSEELLRFFVGDMWFPYSVQQHLTEEGGS